jgi:putative sterol carrier protein
MSEIPRDAARFFGEYVPAQLGRLKPSLAGASSPGAVVFEVDGAGAWSLRLTAGVATVTSGADADALVRIALSAADFEPVVVAGAERFATDAEPTRQLMAARVLTVDQERARLLRDAPGTLALKLASKAGEHRLTLTLGGAPTKVDAPDCEIACALEDLWSIQSGDKNAFELLMDGKLRLTGKMELAMALAAALGSS